MDEGAMLQSFFIKRQAAYKGLVVPVAIQPVNNTIKHPGILEIYLSVFIQIIHQIIFRIFVNEDVDSTTIYVPAVFYVYYDLVVERGSIGS